MIANVIILLLVFGYCGLVIYWKRTGVLKTAAAAVEAETAAAAVDAVAAADKSIRVMYGSPETEIRESPEVISVNPSSRY